MYKYVHNNKYQMKYSEFAKHSEDRKQLEDNIYAEQSEAKIFFWKIIINMYTRASKSGSPRWIFSSHKVFPGCMSFFHDIY